MDATKKRKVDDNNGVSAISSIDGGENPETAAATTLSLTPSDARKIIEKFTAEQLIDIVQSAALRHRDVLASVRSIADGDVTQRKLFVRGLGWETTTDNLRALFSQFGELEEAVVILDKATGKSKGYGFVTFRHVDGAILALKEPSKKIDGRVTVTQLAAAGNSGQGGPNSQQDVSMRKIYVANVPFEMPSEKLCAHFAQYGEIEEGPLGYDKMTGKSKGFALFVYKSAEGAQAALVDPVKMVEGRQLNCKLAIEGKKKGGPQGGGQVGGGGGGEGHGDGMGMGAPNSMAGPMGGHYGGMGSYGGYSGPPMGHHMNSSMQGAQAGSAVGAQGGPGGGAGGYGGGMGGPYGGYGGAGSTGYGGMGGAGAGVGGGMGGAGGGGYRMPPSSAGMASGGYPESGGHYNNLSSGSGFPNQHHQGTGASPLPRVPPGGMYPNVPPYY